MVKSQQTIQQIKSDLTDIFSHVSSMSIVPTISSRNTPKNTHIELEFVTEVKTNHGSLSNITMYGFRLVSMLEIAKKYGFSLNSIDSSTWTHSEKTELTTSILLVDSEI